MVGKNEFFILEFVYKNQSVQLLLMSKTIIGIGFVIHNMNLQSIKEDCLKYCKIKAKLILA